MKTTLRENVGRSETATVGPKKMFPSTSPRKTTGSNRDRLREECERQELEAMAHESSAGYPEGETQSKPKLLLPPRPVPGDLSRSADQGTQVDERADTPG